MEHAASKHAIAGMGSSGHTLSLPNHRATQPRSRSERGASADHQIVAQLDALCPRARVWIDERQHGRVQIDREIFLSLNFENFCTL